MSWKSDERFMRRAYDLACKGLGRTAPNPAVGAVVVKNGRIVGEGYHRRAGTPHAEVMALRQAKGKARGADLYVTLEPCCHFGRTPPCCEAIVLAKVRRVIASQKDPNPLVRGKGLKRLKQKGIRTKVGVLARECGDLNRPYHKWVVSGIPYVTMKAALSLDGQIGTASGDSKWITNEACRQYVHGTRRSVDASLVGARTVRKDDPHLTVRLGNRRPEMKLAVVLDEILDLPLESRLLKRRPGQLIVATTSRAKINKLKGLIKKGHHVLLCRATSDGRIFLPHLLRQLGRLGITSLLVEGGGEVFADFLRRGLVDRIIACVSPKIIGGRGKDWLPGLFHSGLKKAPYLKDVKITSLGDNVVIEGNLLK